jgi:hypothetical protein
MAFVLGRRDVALLGLNVEVGVRRSTHSCGSFEENCCVT